MRALTRLALCVSLVVSIGSIGSTAQANDASAPQAAACTSSVGAGIPPLLSVPSGLPGFHAAWYGQSGYMSLCPGDTMIATVAMYNSGSAGWVKGVLGQVGYLGTWNPTPGQDQPSVLGGDGQLGSPNTGWPRYNRVAIQPAEYVGPNQVAWFQFGIRAPLTPGTYDLYIRPLIEGAGWMEDYGIFWRITVSGTARHVRIVSSLPLQGGQAANTRAMVNAIRMALDETGNSAGGVAIDWVSLDDSNSATGLPDPDIEAANAARAAADPAVIAYIGPFNSYAAKRSIPILCQAGIAMISPTNTLPSLTKPGFGLPDEPARYYPGCARNYARVIPTDELIGTAIAVLGARLGLHKAYVLAEPGGVYSQFTVSTFVARAAQLGIASVGREDIPPPDSTAATAIAARIVAAGADLVYDSGGTIPTPMHAWILQALRAAGSTAAFLGGPDFPSPGFLLPAAGVAAEGAYAVDYLRPDSYVGPGAAWAGRYQARFGALSLADRFAINAFEATNVILAAMNGAAGSVDRATVRANVMATRNFDGALGRWSFDANGDTTLASYSIVRVAGGVWLTTGVVSAAP